MLVTNLTTQDLYFGPLHLPAGIGQQITVDDTSDTSLYNSDDSVADAVNNASDANKISISSAAAGFPRPTGSPQLVHGDGSPEGLVYAPRGSVFMRRDAAATWVLYIKCTPVTKSTGWIAIDTTAAVVPTGSIFSFGGLAVPVGWLLCDGSPYAQTMYGPLFAAIVTPKSPPAVTVTIASPAVFTYSNHGFVVGDTVYLETSGALPTGLSADTPYYVIASGLTTNTFELSATRGGSAINTSGSQSGSHSLYYAPYANSNMSAGNFTVPDLRGRVPVGYAVSGGHADVSSLGATEGAALNSRRARHQHSFHDTADHTVAVPGNYYSPGNNGDSRASSSLTNWPDATPVPGPTDLAHAPVDAPAYVVVNYIIKI